MSGQLLAQSGDTIIAHPGGESFVVQQGDLPIWPSGIPTPLIGRRMRVNPRSRMVSMESRRTRVRRVHDSSIKLMEVMWNFTVDEYDTFRTFFIEELEHGERPFVLMTLEQSPDPTVIREFARDVAFFDGGYQFSGSDNLVTVEAVLEVDAEEFNEIENPFSTFDPEPPVVPEYPSVCRDTIKLSWTLANTFVDGMDIIQISTSRTGPWYDYIVAIPTPAQLLSKQMVVLINNSFNGQRWLRIRRNGLSFRSPAQPLASVVAMPTNVAITNTTVSAYGLHRTGPFVRPVSMIENALINPTEVYAEPVGRLEYLQQSSDWDTLTTIVSATAAPASQVKWTRDGTDPTEALAWPPPKYEYADYNARIYSADFGMAIKARCFTDDCKSPLAILLVDIRHNTITMGQVIGEGIGVYGACDLTIVDPGGSTRESGQSCLINYGGPGGLSAAIEALACSSLTGPSVSTEGGEMVVFKGEKVEDSSTTSWGGWPAFTVGVGKFFMTDVVPTLRHAPFWDKAKAVFEYVLSTFGPSPLKSIVAGSGISSTPLVGAGGNLRDHCTALVIYLSQYVPACVGVAAVRTLANNGGFEVLRSLQNDGSFAVPPVDPPTPPYVPGMIIYGDDFEAYVDTDEAELAVLNDGTGWGGPWHLNLFPILSGEDDMQSYTDGPVLDTADSGPLDPMYEGGGGWDGPWHFLTDATHQIGGDDFESYVDEIVVTGDLRGGVLWEADSFWWLHPALELGTEDFQSYVDGTVTSGTLTGGTRWIAEGWETINY